MLTLNDGRKELYQWDTGRTATVDIECDVVHFANLKYGESLAVEVKGGEVSVPNKLLMSGAEIYCWAFAKDESGAYTKQEQTFNVIKRPKPSDYCYTETEVITIQKAVEDALQEAKESGDFKGEKGEKGDKGDKGDPREVVQEVGQSETAVMSQKATTDEIVALKSDLDDLSNNKINLSYRWVNGNIDSYGNYVANEPTRIMCDYIVTKNKTVNIDITNGYEFVRRYFDNENNYIDGDLQWQTGSMAFSLPYDKMRVVVRKSNNSNITPSESSNISIFTIFIKDLGDLSSKVWLTLGDSITARGWYQEIVKSICDVQYVNYGVGGTSIAKKYDSTTTSFCTRYTEMQDNCDFVTVWGGVNDFSLNIPIGTKGSTNQKQFYGALKVLIEGLINKYPNTKIGFILTPTVNYTDTSLNYCFEETNTEGHKLIDYINAIVDMCNEYSLPVLDLYHNCGMNQLNMTTMTSNAAQTSPDGLHPSMLAMNFMKYQILDFIKTKLLI